MDNQYFIYREVIEMAVCGFYCWVNMPAMFRPGNFQAVPKKKYYFNL